jgi:hypothetical protein
MSSRGPFLVHASFWLAAGVCSLVVVSLPEKATSLSGASRPAFDVSWRPGWRFGVLLFASLLIVYFVAWLTCAAHAEPLPGSQRRLPSVPAQN